MADFYNQQRVENRATGTLNAAVKNFLQTLELTDSQASVVAGRQALVRERAFTNGLMNVEKTVLIGSYARDTQIRSLENRDLIDVDCLFILKTTDWNLSKYWRVGDGGRQALSDLHRAVDGYQGIRATIDAPAVRLSWANMTLEMVPAFPRAGGGFLIPATSTWSTKWQESDPITDAEKISGTNIRTGGGFKPIAKMLKCWNRTHGKLIKSFALETVLYHSVPGFQNFEFELAHFFQSLHDKCGQPLPSPSGVGDPVTIQLEWMQKLKILEAKSEIKAAFTLADIGRHAEAIQKMARVFGRPFQGA